MSPIKSKHIVVALVVPFILFLFYRIGNEDYSYDQNGAQAPIQSPFVDYSNRYDQTYPSSSTCSHNPANLSRHEILQTKVKVYREESYWGVEPPLHDKVRYMEDDEFDDFIEEVELNDADVYWGATY